MRNTDGFCWVSRLYDAKFRLSFRLYDMPDMCLVWQNQRVGRGWLCDTLCTSCLALSTHPLSRRRHFLAILNRLPVVVVACVCAKRRIFVRETLADMYQVWYMTISLSRRVSCFPCRHVLLCILRLHRWELRMWFPEFVFFVTLWLSSRKAGIRWLILYFLCPISLGSYVGRDR